jgi:Transposase DDE domain
VDIDLGREPVPDETTVCKFRHLLEEHKLGARIFERVQEHLQERGLRIGTGMIVDATIVQAPSSTKNARQERDPEMHQTRKGKQWYFGMKAHVGVDSKSKLIHAHHRTPQLSCRRFSPRWDSHLACSRNGRHLNLMADMLLDRPLLLWLLDQKLAGTVPDNFLQAGVPRRRTRRLW